MSKRKRKTQSNSSDLCKLIDIPDLPATESPVEANVLDDVRAGGSQSASKELTPALRAQIELNRQKALLIRQEKLNKQKVRKDDVVEPPKKIIRINDSKLVDTGGGFFVDEKDNGLTEDDLIAAAQLITEPAPLLKEDQPFCDECSNPFDNSYLYHNFDAVICDNCRDSEEKHCLITKTDARNNYLLKDVDFDKRTPILKYIVRKNPHNSRWGDMKLYLKMQIEKRALEVWGTEEALEAAMEKREDQREKTKYKKHLNKMKELRMNVRSSLYTRATQFHEHEYGEESYLSDSDEYCKECITCGYRQVYEKM